MKQKNLRILLIITKNVYTEIVKSIISGSLYCLNQIAERCLYSLRKSLVGHGSDKLYNVFTLSNHGKGRGRNNRTLAFYISDQVILFHEYKNVSGNETLFLIRKG